MLAVLGPVTVDGVPVVGRKTREVLALLALAAPRPITGTPSTVTGPSTASTGQS